MIDANTPKAIWVWTCALSPPTTTTRSSHGFKRALHARFSKKFIGGFTPTRINGEENTQFLIDSPFSLKLLKLNGGFEVVEDQGGFALDYRNHQRTPVMILPSSLQDYRSPYFQCVFEKAATAFQQADVVLFVGYSFPREDILIRRLTAMLVGSAAPGKVKKIFSISRKGSRSIEENLNATLGSRTRDSVQVVVRNCDFSEFCTGCVYWYEKARQWTSLE